MDEIRRTLVGWWRAIATARSVLGVMAAVLIVHSAIGLQIDPPPADHGRELLLGVAYFAFGLYSAFAIDSARGRMARVNELLKAGDADMLALYRLAGSFGTDAQSTVRDHLDRHIQDQIDFRLVHFGASTGSYLELFDAVRTLEPHTPAQQSAYDHLLGVLVAAGERRKQIEALVRQRVSTVEWTTLLVLLGTLWALMLTGSGTAPLLTLLGGALMASLAGMLMLLRHLDCFRWQEESAIWAPLHTLFLSLDLVPYYPRQVVEHRRARPEPGMLRLADYPHPYPDMDGKVVRQQPWPPEG